MAESGIVGEKGFGLSFLYILIRDFFVTEVM